jgi:UDP-2,3-diacylglucosamine hydrolase
LSKTDAAPVAAASWFISDLHLDPSRPAVTAAFKAFLEDIRGSAALYILGDLFEAWPGDDDDAPLARDVRVALRQLTAAGTSAYLLRGNRDFLLGHAFCEATGSALLPDPTVINLHGVETLLMHGDTLCTRDTDYQAFRRTVRDSAWQAGVLAKSLAERRALAASLREESREAAVDKTPAAMDVTPEAVDAAMTAHGASRLVHGHTHRPGRHHHRAGIRWVLGAWEREVVVLKVDSEEARLERMNIP